MSLVLPTLADVEAAAQRIAGRVHVTPLLSCSSARRGGAPVLLKCENLQKVGAFKARGALNHVLQLPKAALARGVATYSSGNHGAALAWAAAQAGSRATIFVPEDVAAPKRAAIEGYGGAVVVAGRTSHDRRVACEEAAAREELGSRRLKDVSTEAERLRSEARMLEKLGAFAFVLECVPATLATNITEERVIPSIGIGAGNGTAGQVLVLSDLLGLDPRFQPRFARRYLEGHELMLEAINRFARDVRAAEFPAQAEVLA